MKKLLAMLVLVFFVSGCTPLNNLTLEEIIMRNLNANINIANQNRSGYRYYLPRGLTVVKIDGFNEIIIGSNIRYYIYFDLLSYFNGVRREFVANPDAYFSMPIHFNDKFGYLEINRMGRHFFIEIMYNYAKIEMIVEEHEINKAVQNAIMILSSIRYNDQVLASLLEENVLGTNEVAFNIFETRRNIQSTYLQAIDSEAEERPFDPDLIR